MIRLAFALALALGLVSVPTRADPSVAAPLTARLEYSVGSGAERCPGEQDLRDAVAVRLGRDPFTPQALHRIVVQLSGAGTELRADFHLFDGSGQGRGSRHLVEASGDCTRLIASIGLTVSLALSPLPTYQTNPQPVAKELNAPPAGGPPGLPPVQSPPLLPATPSSPASPSPSMPSTPATPWRFEVNAGGGITGENVPVLAGGLSAGVAVHKGPWSIGAEARGYFPTSTDPSSEGATAEVALITGAVLSCGTFADPFFVCAVVSVGGLRAKGIGVDVPETDWTGYVGLGGRLGFDVHLVDRFALRFHGDVTWGPLTKNVHLAGEVVWRTPPGGAGAGGELVTFF